MTPKVSIVVPVYNVQAYLAECLDSIVAQTIRDFEVICVEDCSTDRSLSILQVYAHRDERIRVIRHGKNLGLSAARNTGIDESRGEWVLFVDSDDVVSKTLCERTLAAAQENAADVVFYGHAAFCDGEAPPGDPSRSKPVRVDRRSLLARQAFAWTKLVRRDLLIARKIRFPVGLCFEDVPVHWRLALESINPIFLDEAHVGYRQRLGSITCRKDWSRADGLKIYDLIATQLRESGNWAAYAETFRVAEMRNFAATYAYFELANRDLLSCVVAEASRRMSDKHVMLAKSGLGISGWQRSLAISVFSRPFQVGMLTWLAHRTYVIIRSVARVAFNKLR